ncbi:VOC family protein [Pseudomonas sp. RW3S2]|uniref:VOC family protein n=1 Tax=Pseudomonas sp. RW3S2 TaxID=485884 RepID=UPI001EE19E74|nr:VOC family protein [Pseudomonas sp. RW3S2]
MINLHDIRYVRLGTANLDDARRYATQILGLQVAREANGAVYFRSDSRDHTLCYYEGDPRETTTAFEVTSSDELEHAAVLLERNAFKVVHGSREDAEVRHVNELIRFKDHSGNNIELVLRPHASWPAEAPPAHSWSLIEHQRPLPDRSGVGRGLPAPGVRRCT